LFTIIDDHNEMHDQYIESMDANEVNKRPKYPNFLRLIIKTGDVIHYDDKPEVDDGLIPLAVFYCYKDSRIYAEGEVKNLIDMQKTLNEMEESELLNLKLNGNTGWVYDVQSGVDGDTLTNEAGLAIAKEQGTEVTRLQPGIVSQQFQVRIGREYTDMQQISGFGESVLGEAPKHELSSISIRRLQQQALSRVRLKSRMVENAIERRDRLILSRIVKYWSTERKLRVEDGNGKYKYVSFDPRFIRDMPYDLVLSPGTMAGMDNETIYETYKELLIAGAIDFKTFLEVTNLPKKQIILDKLSEQEQVQAQIEQLSQENLMLKAQFAPETLSEEEVKMVQQMQSQ